MRMYRNSILYCCINLIINDFIDNYNFCGRSGFNSFGYTQHGYAYCIHERKVLQSESAPYTSVMKGLKSTFAVTPVKLGYSIEDFISMRHI